MINFEWDELKAAANFAKHGITFADASTVFNDPFALDLRNDQWITVKPGDVLSDLATAGF